jgi:hypothetical protein
MPRPRKRQPPTIREEVPEAFADMVERRCADLLRACTYEPNMLKSLILSCYLQGCLDALQVVEQRPGFLEAYLAITRQEEPPITGLA